MNVRESLRPTKRIRVFDLLNAAGVQTADWAHSGKGPVKVPASNPKYCYEWAFTQPNTVVVVNLWFDEIEEKDGILFRELDVRNWSAKRRASPVIKPASKSSATRRAEVMENAIKHAFENQLPV